MDSVQEIASQGKPVLVASAKDGQLVVMIGSKTYEYWIDSAFHPRIKKRMLKDPWETLNWLKKACSEWRKL